MASNKPEAIMLKRSLISRAAQNMWSLKNAHLIYEEAMREKPYMSSCEREANGDDLWIVEKQFWLKHKDKFQKMGFLPPTVPDMELRF